ncbi:hypothetical protein [Aquimarina sp. RZ0]|uniref:hypothetical protein n=1 Tax=Aquimarina sp. RZ0 TaxID=2607730 RepID=UPI0011F0F3A8|nr:hypothetical protein [Aquimarina sp. RZ0]KAA1247315.1 hypothetical protein F0000_03985 [Aquimarina sp. RZ0]
MKNILKISILGISILLVSCITTKGTDSKNNEKENIASVNTKEMEEKGFIKGTITLTEKSRGCQYIISVEKYKDKLDPINLHDFFKTEIPEKIWVKYNSLRMKSRCNEARPVSITEIQKRVD